MELGLHGRTAIVGGSSRGMGKAAAMALAQEGANVVLCARTEADLRKTEREIARASSPGQVLAVAADLSRMEDIRLVVRGAMDRFGRIEIVLNNLGGPPLGEPSELEDEKWEQALAQNFLSVVRMSREVIPFMKQQRWGRIINLLSTAVKQPIDGLVLSTSSRMAVVGYAKMLSTQLAPFNITVNNVLPGQVLTDRLTSLYGAKARQQGRSTDEVIEEVTQRIPMGRLGRPEEMGDLIAFLASERAGFITGQSVALDGGALLSTL